MKKQKLRLTIMAVMTLLVGMSIAKAQVSCSGAGISVEQKGSKLEIIAGNFQGSASITSTSVTDILAEVLAGDSANFIRASLEVNDEDSQLIIFDKNARRSTFALNCE